MKNSEELFRLFNSFAVKLNETEAITTGRQNFCAHLRHRCNRIYHRIIPSACVYIISCQFRDYSTTRQRMCRWSWIRSTYRDYLDMSFTQHVMWDCHPKSSWQQKIMFRLLRYSNVEPRAIVPIKI